MTIGEAVEDFDEEEQIDEGGEEDGFAHYEEPSVDPIAVEDGTSLFNI
jgi:hypothetical protein